MRRRSSGLFAPERELHLPSRDAVEEAVRGDRMFTRLGQLTRRAEDMFEQSGAIHAIDTFNRKRYWRRRGRTSTVLLPSDDLEFLKHYERGNERSIRRRLQASGHPTAVGSPYRGLSNLQAGGSFMMASSAAVAGTSIALLWPMSGATSPMTTIPANTLFSTQILVITAMGIATTAASSQGNVTCTPLWGTTTGGTSLGASAATALSASLSAAPWFLQMWVFCRAHVNAASGSTLVCGGNLNMPTNVAPTFGGLVVATIDTTTAQGLAMGVTLGSASDTMTTQFVSMETVN